eukprot:NODE_3402_length_375_cov_150.500000_g2736_i0.p3 GENE.NODE_3402_length_375_cov_150.500000_g2736_i0~~NODE_3402_length_375_cov_150.500000_g2736_i0.p3  ORF type:complete len:101 (-),score=21.05 NODE_3402_length_375_cov_150.500000_g2736_i0:73-339(-)
MVPKRVHTLLCLVLFVGSIEFCDPNRSRWGNQRIHLRNVDDSPRSPATNNGGNDHEFAQPGHFSSSLRDSYKSDRSKNHKNDCSPQKR